MPFKKGGGHHKGRKSTRISLSARGTPTTPKIRRDEEDEDADGQEDEDVEDQEMVDVPTSRGRRDSAPRSSARVSRGSAAAAAAAEEEEEEDEEDDAEDGDKGDDDGEDATADAAKDDNDDDEEEEEDQDQEQDQDQDQDDEDSPPKITSIPRRRGRGGRPRGRIHSQNTPEPGGDGSESGTPMRRRRGRPPGSGLGRGRGGFRGRRKGQAPEPPRFIIDKEGNTLDVVDDEAQVDDDDEGNAKVDAKGHLQGGREYRVRTFTILGRDDRLYMLSTVPARCCGFRDSYLFFTKHPKLYKVLIGEEEKKDLIDRDILPNSYKGRNIGVVTARSVFREFGARIVVGGRRVIDDYKVTEARTNGEVEGELADPDDIVPPKIEDYNRNRYVAWFGASEVYRTQSSGVVAQPGKQGPMGKRRNNITVENWQLLHASEASRFNSSLSALRQANLDGVYDTNTNMVFYPKIMQPTHARWEYIPPGSDEPQAKPLTNGAVNGVHLANGDANHANEDDDVMQIDSIDARPPKPSSTFAPVPAVIARNFTIVDVHYESPPISNAGFPGPDGLIEDPTAGSGGLSSISADVLDELPPDCRAAFEQARAAELSWRQRWATEAHSGHRGDLKIGFNGYPV